MKRGARGSYYPKGKEKKEREGRSAMHLATVDTKSRNCKDNDEGKKTSLK